MTGMSAIILSGGKGMRMGGIDKAFLRFRGSTFIEHKLRILKPFFGSIFIVTNTPDRYLELEGGRVSIVRDEAPDGGPLMGLYSGLKALDTDHAFVSTVDAPFLKEELVKYFIDAADDWDVLVPEWKGFLEPLCAVYSRACIPHIREALWRKRIVSFYGSVNVYKIPEAVIRTLDSKGESFININTREEYEVWKI